MFPLVLKHPLHPRLDIMQQDFPVAGGHVACQTTDSESNLSHRARNARTPVRNELVLK
jgi:hypothetical protein